MGRALKNYQFNRGAYAVRLPGGTSSVGPNAPQNGQMRFNETSTTVEAYYGGSWRPFTAAGRVTIIKDTFTGDIGGTTIFAMSVADAATYIGGNAQAVMVFVGGVFQTPETAYTISNTTLTFSSAPGDGVTVIVLHNLNSTIVA